MVYDITKRSSFQNVENHISSFLSTLAPNKGLLHQVTKQAKDDQQGSQQKAKNKAQPKEDDRDNRP